jgi:murein DD-endopeptidase MepM/ murein hydrolase activator NlpD
MERKPNLLDKFTQFITGKGFYVVVLVCIAAIGISGYFLLRSITGALQTETVTAVGTTQMPETSASAAPSPSTSVSPSTSSDSSAIASATPSAAPSASAAPSQTPTVSATTQPAALVFTWPVNGAVIASFSTETLLYDETMLDWRTHEGLDLAASVGTRVLATAAGTVTAVYEDELMGTTIVIDHGDGLESVYSNLGAMSNVSAGDSVYTGDIIAAVGTTASAESGRDAHLHFAMYLDGVAVDPEDYLPE